MREFGVGGSLDTMTAMYIWIGTEVGGAEILSRPNQSVGRCVAGVFSCRHHPRWLRRYPEL